jgi:hypothetical protein
VTSIDSVKLPVSLEIYFCASGGYFWLTANFPTGAGGCEIGATLGATGMGGGRGMLGGFRCCDGEALPRFSMAGRWRTICSLPGAGAM